MKELVSAISHAMANRLKAPILGSFILAWLAINYAELLTFFYNEPKEKLLLLQQETTWLIWSWSAPILMKVIYPFIAAILYTFGLPFIQHLVDVKKHNLIDKKRIEAQHTRLKYQYTSQAVLSEAKAKSSDEYWQDKLKRDLDKWESEREGFETDLDTLRKSHSTTASQLEDTQKQSNEWQNKYMESLKLVEKQTGEIEDLKLKVNDEFRKLSEYEEQFNKRSEEIDKLRAERDVSTQEIKKLAELNHAHNSLRSKSVTAEGVLDLIANLNTYEHTKFDNKYLDNPNFRARVQARQMNEPDFINELLKHENVVQAVLNNLHKMDHNKLKTIMANMGYIYAPNTKANNGLLGLSSLTNQNVGLAALGSLAEAAVQSQEPMENE